MLQIQHRKVAALAALVVALAAPSVAHADPDDGTVISVSGTKKGAYPIAVPQSADSDTGAATEIATVASFDLGVAGVFKVLDPASFLDATPGLDIDPQRWKDVGAYGVVKYKVSPDSVEFRLYEVSKGTKPSLTKTYPRKGEVRTLTHRWCNEVVKYYTGENGFFGSKIAFTAKGKGTSAIYAMDFDGANAYSVSRNSSTNILRRGRRPAHRSRTRASCATTRTCMSRPRAAVGRRGSRRRRA